MALSKIAVNPVDQIHIASNGVDLDERLVSHKRV